MKPGAIAIVLDAEKQNLLLVKRWDINVWVLPGGGIDDGETAEQAVIRETLEETGVEVIVVRKVAEYSPINRFTSTAHLFVCQPVGGRIKLSDESAAVGYFPLDALPKKLFLYHREWLKEALALAENAPPRRQPMSRLTFWRIFGFYFSQPIAGIRYLIRKMIAG